MFVRFLIKCYKIDSYSACVTSYLCPVFLLLILKIATFARTNLTTFNYSFMKRYVTLLLLCFLTLHVSLAQVPRLYTIEQGLATSRVSSSYIDSNGILWIMGDHTLSYFDGNRFHSVVAENTPMGERISIVYSMLQVDDNLYYLATGFGLYLFDSRTMRFTQIDLGEDAKAIVGYPVSSLCLRKEKNEVFVTTAGFGAFVVNLATHTMDKAKSKTLENLIGDSFVFTTFTDRSNRIWCSTRTKSVMCINAKNMKQQAVNFDESLQLKMQELRHVNCMDEDPKTHNLLIGCTGIGLILYDSQRQCLREIAGNNPFLNPRSILYTKRWGLVVGTDNAGLWRFNPVTEQLEHINLDTPGQDFSVSKIHHMVEDDEGNIVASLYQKGVLVIPNQKGKMRYVPVSSQNNGKNSSSVSSMCYIDGSYWVSTDGGGIYKTDNLSLITFSKHVNGLRNHQTMCVTSDANGHIWAASYGGGIQVLDGDTWVTPPYVAEISSLNALYMVCDKQTNCLYVCTNGGGIYEVDINNRIMRSFSGTGFDNPWVSQAVIDSHRNLWVLYAMALTCYNLDTKKTTVVNVEKLHRTQLHAIAVGKDCLYIGTSQGLATCSYKDFSIEMLPSNERLSDLNVVSVLPVKNDLWLGLRHGVARISANGEVINYSSFPGFYIGELHQRSGIVTHEGYVCFGGDNGIVALSSSPDEHQSVRLGSLFITGLEVEGKQVMYDPDSNDNIIDASIFKAESITLKPDQNTFVISFGSTEYAHAENLVYEYMLDGYESVWHRADFSSASAYYASVPSGNYTFRVRAHIDNEEHVVETSIEVVILHPWYDTWWAWLIYILVTVAIAAFLINIYKVRARERMKMRQLLHDEQLKEAKLRLFTSIAHELRTPLTMILSPLKQLKSTDESDERMSLYEVMQRNCDRLLNIVKQITDVRKIDNGQLRLNFSEIDFVTYCADIMASFSGIASAKNIQFTHFCDNNSIRLWADSVHFEKVIVNLLSNAFKFTPVDGKILLHTECKQNTDNAIEDKRVTEYLECRFYNSGSHIDERDIDHIYERFYQGVTPSSSIGSGIGLNLVYELVKLHHGTISVRNIDPDGVEFVVRIPLGNRHLTDAELTPREMPAQAEDDSSKAQIENLESAIVTEQNLEAADAEETKCKKRLLIVDDNKDLCDYVRTQLENDYNITVCFSGNSAWKEVLKVRPDVVITDLIMPDGDGYELCKHIKQNPETSHIPVIMLTGESDERSRIAGMQADVDQFLNKPFNIILLRGALGQVLRVRENLTNKLHRTDINHDYAEVQIDSYEDKFFTKINELVKAHIDDSDFTVEMLAKEVGISRVHLNRKLKEQYGMTPNAYIKSMRLKQAAFLLVNNKVNISEVAYKVGFASHSYFTNNFHDYFGMTPTEFVAYYGDNTNDEQLKKLLE